LLAPDFIVASISSASLLISPSGAELDITSDLGALRLERDGDHVRLITRGGYNWTDRYPWIVDSRREQEKP
jgi:hypothetical protein